MRVSCDSKGISMAIRTIKSGGCVVFPTDTVYGLGCDPYNSNSVKLVYRIKKRNKAKLVPVLGYSKKELLEIAFFNDTANKLAEKFWPGQLTMVLSLKDEKLKNSLKLDKKIAVRVPNNQCILSILKKCKVIVGTSANISGTQSFTNPDECIKQISNYDLFVDGGIIPNCGESTVVEIEKELKILREGMISKKEILNVL